MSRGLQRERHLLSGALAVLLFSTLAEGVAAQTTIPDFTGQWGRDMIFFEPPPSGPGPIMRVLRNPDGSRNMQAPCCRMAAAGAGGIWDGDYTNPILKPEAAEAVKKYRDLGVAGTVPTDLNNSCWPEPPPFVLSEQFGVNILQKQDEITLIYLLHSAARRVRLNVPHSKNPTPTWQGESVGWFEGDTLVIDTIGIKVAPFSTVDSFGTPHSDALHVVERYRFVDGETAAETQTRNGGVILAITPYERGAIDPDTRKKGLQIEFTVEDGNVFTTPWRGQVTYRPTLGVWPEAICAENPYFLGSTSTIPTAVKPDF